MVLLSHPSRTDDRQRSAPGPLTVGIDIGTTSVKAVLVDGSGRPLRRTRVLHSVRVTAPDRLEHDPAEAWVRGPRAALAALFDGDGRSDAAVPAAVAVSAMTPSIAAVDCTGTPTGTGVLYDDVRGRAAGDVGGRATDPMVSGETAALLQWSAATTPGAVGHWPAQAVANRALGGRGALDYASACSTGTLFDGSAWDPKACATAGVGTDALPEVALFGAPIGTVAPSLVPGAGRHGGVILGAGGVDAFCEQMVAGADSPGDVLIVCGSTLVVWATVEGWPQPAGVWTLPHLKGGRAMVGGASNAGGLFLDWVGRVVAPATAAPRPASVPVWWPYIRGERVPLHDPYRRAALGGLDLTVGPAEVRRAAREASGFAARHILEAAGVVPGRVVVTGGGARDRELLQALADVLGTAVTPVAVPEGAALGAAWLARMAAGLETSIDGAAGWASTARQVDPDLGWAAPTAERYQRYRRGIAEEGELRVR